MSVSESALPPVAPERTTVIRPPRKFPLPDFRELWRFRELLGVLGRRDVTVRYRQTLGGIAWIFVGPVLSALVFTFLFGRVAGLPTEGIPYFTFSYGSLLVWNVFTATLGKSSSSLTGNENLVAKVYFPRLVLPLATVPSTMVNFGVAFVLVLVLLVTTGVGISWTMLTLPLWLALALGLAFGLGFVLAALAVPFRDVGYIAPLLTQMLLYLSPVAYAEAAIPERFEAVYNLNPIVGLMSGVRWAVFGLDADWGAIAYSTGAMAVLLIIGTLAFTKIEHVFPDVI